MNNVYSIRRAILASLREYGGVPVKCDELVSMSPAPAIRAGDPELIRQEWRNLKDFGYIEPIEGFGGEYCKISRKGLEQASPEFSQDPYIYGPTAIR